MAVAHDHDDDHDHDVVEREHVVERAPSRTVAGTTVPNIVRLVLTILGAAAMIVGSFLVWVAAPGGDVLGTELPLRAFYRPALVATSSFITSPGAVMILLGLLALLGMAGRSGWLTRIAGALGIIALVLVAIEMYRAAGVSLPEDVGPGMWVALAGSVVALVGGFFSVAPYLVDDDH